MSKYKTENEIRKEIQKFYRLDDHQIMMIKQADLQTFAKYIEIHSVDLDNVIMLRKFVKGEVRL